MTITKRVYQCLEAKLDEIQEFCAQGIGEKNSRNCLLDISALVYQMRSEMREGIMLDNGE